MPTAFGRTLLLRLVSRSLLLTLVLGCPRTPPGNGPGPTPSEAAARPARGATTVLDAGSRPRQPVVLALKPGAFDCVLQLTEASKVELTGPDGEAWSDDLPMLPLPPLRMLNKVVLAETEDPSRLRHTTTVFDVVASAPADSLVARTLREQKGAMVGQQLVVSVAVDGTRLATLREPGVPDGLLTDLSLQDRALATHVPFPREPVGIGARWRVPGEERRFSGMVVSADSVYTLRERDPERVVVDVETEMTVLSGAEDLLFADADTDAMDLPVAVDTHIERLSLHAEGSLTVWLSSGIVEGWESNTVEVGIRVDGPDGGGVSVGSATVLTYEMSAREVGAR